LPRSAALPRRLSHAPGELTGGRLRRLAEGVGKVVYASEHWVVKRERPASEVIALIAVWKLLRGLAHILPAHLGERLLRRPSKLIRPLRLLVQAVGARVTHQYDRPWGAAEARDGRLVVIGLKGLDRAAVTRALVG
jgi:hypothetical protein